MENTLENKANFFAQYHGQEVMKLFLGEYDYTLKLFYGHCAQIISEEHYLELKPLSSITDDELGAIARFYEQTATNVYIHDNQLTFDYYSGDEINSVAIELNSGFCLDFLRNNGFAIEWMGLTVTKLQEYGWITLKTDNHG